MQESMVDGKMLEFAEQAFGGPISLPMAKVTVKLQPTGMIDVLAKQYSKEIERILSVKGGSVAVDLSEKALLKYFTTALYMRVIQVTDAHAPKGCEWFRVAARSFSNLIVFANLLVQVGVAVDKEYGLKFIPSFEPDATNLLTGAEFMEMSDTFLQLESHGLKIVMGLPADKVGSLPFMACEYFESDDSIRSYRREHPVFGFYAAFFRNIQAEEMLAGPKRIIYGYRQQYEMYISEMVSVAHARRVGG